LRRIPGRTAAQGDSRAQASSDQARRPAEVHRGSKRRGCLGGDHQPGPVRLQEYSAIRGARSSLEIPRSLSSRWL
jgi:hypothetical protein